MKISLPLMLSVLMISFPFLFAQDAPMIEEEQAPRQENVEGKDNKKESSLASPEEEKESVIPALELEKSSFGEPLPSSLGLEKDEGMGFASEPLQFEEGSTLGEEVGPGLEPLYILADSYTHLTPFGGPRLTLVTGELRFGSIFGGRSGSDLDLNDDLFVDEEQLGVFSGIDVQHHYFRISLAYGFSSSKSRGNINRQVLIADSLLQQGAQAEVNIDTHWFNGILGYTLIPTEKWGLGLRVGFNYIFIRLNANIVGFLADNPTNPQVSIDLDNSLFIPIPTIGGYFDIAIDPTYFVLRTELDFIYYDISNRRLLNLNFSLESRFYFIATQEYYGYFRFQYEYFQYDFDTTEEKGFYEWHSFLFLVGCGVKF